MKFRLMIVNVFFSPKSFGGATIVAEELAKLLANDWEVLIVTTIREKNKPNHYCLRYSNLGLDIVAINQLKSSKIDTYMNPQFAIEFSNWLKSFSPDIVHFHSIQTMGAEMLTACEIANIPFIVTLHDNWWICARQFMINRYKKYCWQTKIDLSVCMECVDDINNSIGSYGNVKFRYDYLAGQLNKATYLLFPSEFHRRTHINNLDVDIAKMIVNKNGVKFPSTKFQREKCQKVRFGFVGGVGPIKGFDLILDAFGGIESDQYILYLVDNTMNLGFKSIKINPDHFAGTVEILKSYTQATMDDFYSKIDVLLFPSQWKESFGLTVREALIRDVWVVATSSGGAVEDIVDGKNGNIIPMDGDYLKLQQCVEKLIPYDFSKYSNSYKSKIQSYDVQAEEINQILVNSI